MHMVIFEDACWHQFAPLSLSRPVFLMATGLTSLLEKQIRHLKPTRLTLWVRPEFEAYCRERVAGETGVPTTVNTPLDHEPALLVNARAGFSKPIEWPNEPAAARSGESVTLAYVRAKGLGPADAIEDSAAWRQALALPPMTAAVALHESPVDLLYWNSQSIAEDFGHLPYAGAAVSAGGYHLVNASNIWIGRGVKLMPGCVLDATQGPIALGDGATIESNAVVQGPVWIGPGSTVAPLGMIRPGTSIGPLCKVGGEISVSIFLGCSNKSHEGFVGQSYIGKWANFGAGTTVSNLKNTYGPISIRRGEREIPTGRNFVGALVGDHAKTGILTRIMCGSYIGFNAMVAAAGTSPRFVPSMTFLTDRGAERYQRDKAEEVARRVFARRNHPWAEADATIMDYVIKTAPLVER